MRLEQKRLVDEALVSEEPCLGAVFCSYTFDPAYFEEHVLRALLRLRSDPDEDGTRYHEEARRALQETPVACFVDASVRRGGRRLPYDLRLIHSRTFHPKLTLILYASEARLAVGSGNVTRAGLEQNTELFFVRRLRYDEPADAALLREVDAFLADCAAFAHHPGTQLAAVREALAPRIADTPPLGARDRIDARVVASFSGSLLDQIAAALPADARIRRIGVLAPFFEQDDLAVGDIEAGLSSVLAQLLAVLPSGDAVLDVGVPWDDAPLAPPAGVELPTLEDHLGKLWVRKRPGSSEPITHLVIERVTARRIEARDAAGEPCRLDREALEAEIKEGNLWPAARPTAYAPKRILERLAAERPVRLWLHPTASLAPSGRPRRRPLHAKLFLVCVTHRGSTLTYALIGSANASRAALERSVAAGSNVEAGVLCRFDGEISLRDFLPALVSYPLAGITLQEREIVEPGVDLSSWIEDVVHDAALRTLTITWREQGPAPLGAWSLHYLDRVIASGTGPGSAAIVIQNFDLAAASAEVLFCAGEHTWPLPIRIADLTALPTSPHLAALGLRELLALLGRRVGAERIAALREERGAAGAASVLDAVFGEGFGPTDVFKAWWGLAEDLAAPLTVPAFRHRLLGPTGARTAWERLRDVPRHELGGDEVWVYGCELLRELERVPIQEGPDREAKQGLIQELLTGLRADLARLTPVGDVSWLAAVSRFHF